MHFFYFLASSAIDDLRRNKVRSLLTALGIMIGVLSVVLLIAFGLGLKNYIRNQFESLGTNIVIVLPGKIVSSGGFRSGGGSLGSIKFDEKDIIRLKKIKEAEFAVPLFMKTVTAVAPGESELSDIIGTTADIFSVRNLEIETGRLFSQTDLDKRSKKVVIGPKIAEKLFGYPDLAVGKSLTIEGQNFGIMGVLKKKGGGGLGGPDFDSFIYAPYKSVLSLNPDKKFVSIYLKTSSGDQVAKLKESAKTVLLKRYKDDEFSVIEQTEILNIVTSIFSMLNSVLVAIGSISLLVGGVGIMNIMYATVTERVREIGIRRAVGATKGDILLLFLFEAVILSLFGGLLGLILSVLIVIAIQPFFPAGINMTSIFAALGVSSLIGIFFGVFPAGKAANLSPIEAIRYE